MATVLCLFVARLCMCIHHHQSFVITCYEAPIRRFKAVPYVSRTGTVRGRSYFTRDVDPASPRGNKSSQLVWSKGSGPGLTLVVAEWLMWWGLGNVLYMP
ncbi:hypothetical protein V6N13_041577 [Hibiscus sabdariffa]